MTIPRDPRKPIVKERSAPPELPLLHIRLTMDGPFFTIVFLAGFVVTIPILVLNWFI